MVLKSGQLPKSMVITDVRRNVPNPIAGGGFADVWRGLYEGQEVALKVLRFFGQSESDKQIIRVSSHHVYYHLKH